MLSEQNLIFVLNFIEMKEVSAEMQTTTHSLKKEKDDNSSISNLKDGRNISFVTDEELEN